MHSVTGIAIFFSLTFLKFYTSPCVIMTLVESRIFDGPLLHVGLVAFFSLYTFLF